MALLGSLANGCGAPAPGTADESATLPSEARTSEALATPLNPNDEFLIYDSRFRTTDPFSGERGTFFADVTGDGKADAIAVNNAAVIVRRASTSGSTFGANEQWTNSPFWGSLGTFFADVTGDGKADAIANDPGGIVVSRALSTGTAFKPAAELWSSSGTTGSHGTFVADVTGDGKADFIVATDSGIVVRRANSAGTAFGANEVWTNGGVWGTRQTLFADVTGDRKADVIVVNGNGLFVRRSNGTRFLSSETWTSEGFNGSAATFAADVTADGLADIVAVNSDAVWLRRSNRFHFASKELLAEQTNLAAPSFADINGDKRADVLETSSAGIWLSKSRTRDIRLRFVQFTGPGVPGVTGAALDAALLRVNTTYASAGIRFLRWGSHSVPATNLYELIYGNARTNPAADFAPAHPFNPSCNIDNLPSGANPDWGFVDDILYLNMVGTRCAQPRELVVYIARLAILDGQGNWQTGDNLGFRPDHGKTVLINPEVITDLGSNIFAHELGHSLGLEHPEGAAVIDPATMPVPPSTSPANGWKRLAWDMVYQPGSAPYRASPPSSVESLLKPISGHSGSWCPDSNNAHCPDGAPLGTFSMPVADKTGALQYYSTDDEIMKGLALLLPDGTRTANVMYFRNQGNSTSLANNFIRALSLSQIEEIRRVLTIGITTWVKDAQGGYIPSDRPQLGR